MSSDFTWVEISRSALKYNLQQFRKILNPSTKVMTVVKSNAYGHGMVKTAKFAIKYGSEWLGTVNLEEALNLRKNGLKTPILVLSYYPLAKKPLEQAIKQNISLVAYSLEQLNFLNRLGKSVNKKSKVHLKIDTGTSRLGILFKDALSFIVKAVEFKNLEIEGIFSHFAASEENQDFTKKQLNNFSQLLQELEKKNIFIPLKHFACSAATLVQPDSHFNLVRLGIAAYGLWPSVIVKKIVEKNYPSFHLRPILSWQTKIIQIKLLARNSFIGYGCTFRVKRKTKLAILPIGYWEGIDRHFSNPPTVNFPGAGRGEVLIKGKRCPILGRVCMNLLMVDVTNISNPRVGERVVIIGRQGQEEITAEEVAKKCGTINYEVVTRINPLLPRIYI